MHASLFCAQKEEETTLFTHPNNENKPSLPVHFARPIVVVLGSIISEKFGRSFLTEFSEPPGPHAASRKIENEISEAERDLIEIGRIDDFVESSQSSLTLFHSESNLRQLRLSLFVSETGCGGGARRVEFRENRAWG